MASLKLAKVKNPHQYKKNKKVIIGKLSITGFAIILLSIFFMPLIFGIMTSLKSSDADSDINAPLLPSSAEEYNYNGKNYPLFNINYEGKQQKAALIEKGKDESQYLLVDSPDKQIITKVGFWRNEEKIWKLDFRWENYIKAAKSINMIRLLLNTLMYAVTSTAGMVISSSIVAFGFARFRFPGRSFLFGVVLATIILPPSITLIPTYAFFYKIGLVGTWWPLILPAYFSNAFNIFLLRQYFMGIPKECDEAAMIDGASYFRIFYSIILPQSVPALIAVGLFHFFYCWNDYFGPMIYLLGHQDKYPISLGLTQFNSVHSTDQNMIQAASVIALIVPVILFFFCQKYFTKGISVGTSGEN